MTLSRTSFLAILLLLLCQHPTTVCRAGPQQMKKLTHFSFPNSMVQSMKRITAYSLLSTFLLPLAPAQAIEWTSFNRAAAEVWRTVDDLYLDRSFNGKDWFALRQQLVKRNYESETDFSSAMKDALMQLGDKYTRYLTPAQYDALLSSAQGSLVGIGAELAEDSEQHTGNLLSNLISYHIIL